MQDLGAIEVSRSVADHLSDMLPRSAPHLRSSFCTFQSRSTAVLRFKDSFQSSCPFLVFECTQTAERKPRAAVKDVLRAALLRMLMDWQKDIIQDVLGNGDAKFLAHVARSAEVDACPDASFLNLIGGIGQTFELPSERIVGRVDDKMVFITNQRGECVHERPGQGRVVRDVLWKARGYYESRPGWIPFRGRVAIGIRQPDRMIRPPQIVGELGIQAGDERVAGPILINANKRAFSTKLFFVGPTGRL
jgi:hypothetical protein